MGKTVRKFECHDFITLPLDYLTFLVYPANVTAKRCRHNVVLRALTLGRSLFLRYVNDICVFIDDNVFVQALRSGKPMYEHFRSYHFDL